MRILCVDDDIEYIETVMKKEEVYCKKYGLDQELVDYVSNLDEAIERIQDPDRMSAYDLVLLDIKIEGGINEKSKAYLKHIVTDNKIEKYESRFGGFYLYLSLLQEGFPNERIAFLSGYVEDGHETSAVLVSEEPFEQLKVLLENIDEIEKAKLKDALAAIKEMIDIEEYSRFMNMLEDGAYEQIKEAVGGLHMETEKSPIKKTDDGDTQKIHGHFQAFFDAGIHISEKNKFSKQENASRPDQEVVFDTPLNMWINSQDQSGYYSLRYGIIQGCQRLLKELRNSKQSWDLKIDQAFKAYKEDGTEESLKNLRQVLKNKDANSLEFYKYGHYSDYQKGSYLNHIQYDSTTMATRYPFEYFENMLTTFQWILPVREPSNKGELYNHLVKILTHPWEAAIASYKDSVSSRHQLFNNCISSIAKTTRNWTAHSRLNQFNEQDVAFLFIVLMRTFFKMDLHDIKHYESHLLNYVIKDTTFKNGTIHRDRFLSTDMQNKLTNSLKTLNDRKKQDQAKDLNILSIFSDIGKHQDCDVKDLYLMFTHIACYPWVLFRDKAHLNYNYLHNNIEDKDIFSKLLKVSLNKAGF